MNGSFTPTRKSINISHLYTTLMDIRECITTADDYVAVYFYILRNLTHMKRIRTFLLNAHNLKLSIGKTQNLASFVHLCCSLTKMAKKKSFECCLLPPLESEYILWQRCIIGLQKARKLKRSVVSLEYKFRDFSPGGDASPHTGALPPIKAAERTATKGRKTRPGFLPHTQEEHEMSPTCVARALSPSYEKTGQCLPKLSLG